MDEREKQVIVDQLQASRTRLLELVEDLTPEQWEFRESPGRWTIAENIEHVIAVEEVLPRVIRKALRGEAEPGKMARARSLRPFVFESAKINQRIVNRVEALDPRGRFADPAEMLRTLAETHASSLAFIAGLDREQTGALRSHFHPHQAFGDLDCFQWLVVMSLHGGRHAAQIAEIQAAPTYPHANLRTTAPYP